jgi:hypothetical protein
MKNYKTIKIFLSGKMSGLPIDESNGWRLKAMKLFNDIAFKNCRLIKTINPIDFYNYEMDKNSYTEKEIKKFDLHMVRNSDIILVDLNHPGSIGTAIEVETAEVNNKIIIGFGKQEGNYSWTLLSIDKICDTLEDAVNYINNYYLINL